MNIIGFIAGVALAGGWVQRLRCHAICNEASSDYQLLRDRLEWYAIMKSCSAEKYTYLPKKDLNFNPTGMLLSARQHDILLGTLKKIETKSTAVAVISIFLATLIAGALDDPNDVSYLRILTLYLALSFLSVMLVVAVDGAGHLGQRHYRSLRFGGCIRGQGVGAPIMGRELQRALMHDLLKKEASFDAMIQIGGLAMLAIGLAFVL
ncbi:hypothetical protein [Paenirhodobacter populi]|uniref:Uncharacterized protein n=1 Tax=Paenirhodobacter populi TaxID=2306993 RepID=A0A443J0J0_9RHOB|nr:hypothetical protein [Sinirhodobacter populi]RWR13882.1 hypothetical protein D2T33_05670 [Sinirhodobacter populi]